MTAPKNPVAEAEESGLAYTKKETNPAYILVNLHREEDNEGHLSIDVSTEGVNREQSITILTAVLEMLKGDVETISLRADEIIN